MPILNNWSVGFIGDTYTAPEYRVPCLQGEVSGHPRHEEGKPIMTTRPIGKKGEMVITKSGTIYTLGTIDQKYAEMFPNARERLFNSLPETA